MYNNNYGRMLTANQELLLLVFWGCCFSNINFYSCNLMTHVVSMIIVRAV